jgi:hypothetical protein
MKPCALFLSNEIYFNLSKQEGGVRVCTEEYLSLIAHLYDVEVFKVHYRFSYAYRLLVKLGLNVYCDYKPELYAQQIIEVIRKRSAEIVFLNLSNTAPFARLIKEVFGSQVKVVLCSHGNESGDFLHEATLLKNRMPFYRSLAATFVLGSLLKKEAAFRQTSLDGVLTVSPIEEAIEKWLGAKKVLMIPRTLSAQKLILNSLHGRIGFIGDLSHWPNFYGIDELCKALEQIIGNQNIELRIVGSPSTIGERLASQYRFVNYRGYLNYSDLKSEVSSWTFFINPVFYYSRGVSTKLAKVLGWGLPVITTEIGCRGYSWQDGNLLFAESPKEMALAIIENSNNQIAISEAINEVEKVRLSMPSLDFISKDLKDFLASV